MILRPFCVHDRKPSSFVMCSDQGLLAASQLCRPGSFNIILYILSTHVDNLLKCNSLKTIH